MKKIASYIAGEPRFGNTAGTFELHYPATGEIIAHVAEAGKNDVDDAVSAARAALNGRWGKMGQRERLALLDRVADRIMERFDEFLEAELQDTGKPASFARNVDIPRGAANFRIFANMMRSFGTDAFETETADGLGALNYTIRRPVGVIGVICPWNLPLLLMTWKVAPALATGNTVVVKPSEETPQTATLLAQVMREVGVPDGVYNVVHGFGPGSAGEALTTHPGVDAITFTGESATGTAIMRAAAPGVKAVSFELGGKNPAIVFADADMDDAVAGTIRSTFSNCGQVCLCSERVYVERPIFEEFVDRLARGANDLTIGDPFADSTGMGPVISREHREKVLGHFERAKADGATVHAGGGVPQVEKRFGGGYFVEPTVFSGLGQDSALVQQEVFGPVCHVMPFDDDEEAVALANDTDYGLCAAVWTTNLKRTHRIVRELDVGIAWVNTWFLRDLRTPFGGVKLSGVGREGGIHSLNFYSELRNVCIKL